jgi:hypothetical protein
MFLVADIHTIPTEHLFDFGDVPRYSEAMDDAPAAVLGTGTSPLGLAAARSRPIATADTRTLQVSGALGAVVEGIRRGSTVLIGSALGGVSLALALVAETTGAGKWTAAVGLPWLGLAAAGELGVRLDRFALVPAPGDRWPGVASALLDGMDMLLLGPMGRVRPADARRLTARVRECGTVLVALELPGRRCWPEAPDLCLSVTSAAWEGLGAGHGHLRSRRVEVVVTGRRAATRERRALLWLPGPAGLGGPQQGLAGLSGHQETLSGHQQTLPGPGGHQRILPGHEGHREGRDAASSRTAGTTLVG